MKHRPAYKAKSGSTLAELIVLMTVMGILMSVAIPPLAALYNKLSLRKLDTCARTIGFTVQNRLSKLELYGSDIMLLSVAGTGENGEYYMVCNSKEGEAQVTYDGSGAGFPAVLDLLCPADAIGSEIDSGCYAISFTLEPNVVTEVFYSESSFDYENVSAMCGEPGWRQWREENGVGCYRCDVNLHETSD